jgi:GT2 family glycosyltransferase
MNSQLSVVIPTYKRVESLRRLLDALFAQKDVVLEIIIVDQNPEGFLDNSIPANDNVRRIRLDKPNVSTARNIGYEVSTSDLILFIDDDLIPENDFCKKAISIFAEHAYISCFSPLVYNDLGKDSALELALSKKTKYTESDQQIFSITDTISAAVFFRKNFFLEAGGFDPLLFEFARTAEDQEFFLRMRKRNLSLYFVTSVDIFHDEKVPGGCDLRTADYWITRERCIKSWVYRRRIHQNPLGKLSLKDYIELCRSSFLNKETLFFGVKNIVHNVQLLKDALASSKFFLKKNLSSYEAAETMNHLRENKTYGETNSISLFVNNING